MLQPHLPGGIELISDWPSFKSLKNICVINLEQVLDKNYTEQNYMLSENLEIS